MNYRFPKKLSFRPRIKYGMNSSRNPVFSEDSGCRIKSGMTKDGICNQTLNSGLDLRFRIREDREACITAHRQEGHDAFLPVFIHPPFFIHE